MGSSVESEREGFWSCRVGQDCWWCRIVGGMGVGVGGNIIGDGDGRNGAGRG